MSACPLTWLDVFAPRPLTGNGLAVVHEADRVDEATMAAFARETKLSETTFVQVPVAPGADYRTRIWTPFTELPFAGHPSLGTAVAVALRAGRDAASYVQETHAGLQPIEVERAGEAWRASMLQQPAEFGEVIDSAEVLAAVGLGPGEAHPELPARPVSCGVRHLLVPIADAAALDHVELDQPALAAVLEPLGCVVAYVVAVDGARCFARSLLGDPSLREDPATGSAAGPLVALLAAAGGPTEIEIEQGVAMGRPSVLKASLEGDRPRVGGDVHVIGEGTVRLGHPSNAPRAAPPDGR